MGKLWTGQGYKENATPVEIQAGLDHIVRELKKLRQQVRPGLPLSEVVALREKIDVHFEVYNANVAAMNNHEERFALEERAGIIDGLPDPEEDGASKA